MYKIKAYGLQRLCTFAHGRVITKLNRNQCLQECCKRPGEWHKQRRNETYFYTQAQLFDNA
jgi:hypothetical protein